MNYNERSLQTNHQQPPDGQGELRWLIGQQNFRLTDLDWRPIVGAPHLWQCTVTIHDGAVIKEHGQKATMVIRRDVFGPTPLPRPQVRILAMNSAALAALFGQPAQTGEQHSLPNQSEEKYACLFVNEAGQVTDKAPPEYADDLEIVQRADPQEQVIHNVDELSLIMRSLEYNASLHTQ
jgi:hypothetical protein